MDALLTIARSIRRAFSRAHDIPTRPAARAIDVPQDAAAAELLDTVDALRLDLFRRQMRRYTRPELAQLGSDLADSDIGVIRDAVALTVAQFARWEAVRAARTAQADTARLQSADADATVANLAACLLALMPPILHRAARRALRPVILTQCR